MNQAYTPQSIKDALMKKLINELGVEDLSSATDETFYKAAVLVIKDILFEKRRKFRAHNLACERKQVYYLSMEFLLGRSLKNNLFNLELEQPMREALGEMDVKLDKLYDCEPDAGLGNGGLGRLAACYLDGLATSGYVATGYSLLYEYGVFRQKMVDGWQTELPDQWLPGGEIWLTPRHDHAVDIRFGGQVEESWELGYHTVSHTGYSTVRAIPYDITISGYNTEGVSLLRLWRAKSPTGMDMESFNRGDYTSAFEQLAFGEAISKVLYPNDNHNEGKNLRLRQQYFLCAASIADICRRHLAVYGTLTNFAEKNAIHINDTHPTLAIPEFMRFLLDDCGYDWELAWDIVQNTFAYTNHTVMKEAMECWDEAMFRSLLPRLHTIVCEINRRFCSDMFENKHVNSDTISRMSIVEQHQIRMANLAVIGSHNVNGVSSLHSQILRDSVFNDFCAVEPHKFTNVTNGIASRRWLIQSNPSLTALLRETLGENFDKDLRSLEGLLKYENDSSFLGKLADSKLENKRKLCDYVQKTTGVVLNPHSIFDVQAKRLHEYKRQQLNVLHIISLYQYLKENPTAPFVPRTFFFAAKAAPGYFMAKHIIKLICSLSTLLENDPDVRDKLRVVFLENYSVTLSELLMPAAEISEQISLAGTEASGTGNMKLMLNGAITLGTLDGANVEIYEAVGDENILLFGLKAHEVDALRSSSYDPRAIYQSDVQIQKAVDFLMNGFGEESFPNLYEMLTTSDYYMTLADFTAYRDIQQKAVELYQQPHVWQKMALHNIARSGVFSADRAVTEYANNIWGLTPNCH